MKYKKQLVAALVAIFATVGVINAQQKYAVIITGDNNAVNVPADDQWNEGQGMGTYGYDEFWNDSYLFWEMLYTEKGYTDENIFVYYDDGNDLTFPLQAERYNAFLTYGFNVTDEAATKANVEYLFNTILPSIITQDDFLYVWVMSHGGNTQGDNDGDSYFYLQNGEIMYDYELADLVNPINANRKVFQFQCPASGGYINNLTGDNVYIFSSTSTNGESYRADDDPVIENEEINGIIYNHGEFNFHTYSAMNGETPDFSTTYNGQSLSDANANDNQFISFGEAKDWNATQQSTSENPESLGDIGFYSAADYPTLFIDDFTENATYRGIIGADRFFAPYDDEIYLSNNSITIASNAKATFFRDTKLVIDGSGVMTIEDDVELNGYSGASGILSFNEIYVGENVLFRGDEDPDDWGGLVVAEDKTLDLLNVTFQNCYLITNTFGLDIDDCNFIRSGIRPYVQNISVNNSQFLHSWIEAIKPEIGYGSAQINNCTITDPTNELDYRYGIKLWAYDDYAVTNCYIDGYKGDGVRIVTCGFDVNSKNRIENNTILNSAQWYTAGAMAGLSIIDSYATIHNNHIENNDRGIVTTWHSTVSLYGDYPVVTQKVINNTINQIWSTEDSFPFKFRLNEMHGTSNPPYHIVYLSTENDTQKDITKNCWGSTFDPNNPQWYFYPLQNLIWDPYWECGGDDIGIAGDDQLLFESAQLKVENEDYYGAETDYLALVENYPESEYARAAIKELYRLEKETGNDYDALQTYYETNPTIQANDGLKNTGEKLAVDCEVRDENYIAALDMLEEFINNPSTDYDDSLFAVNELGYIYYLMENGNGKSAQIIESPSTKFAAKDILDDNTNHHLSLLFKDDVRKESLEQSIEKLKSGELLQNIPNPFNGSTEIYYKLQSEALINIRVYSYTGQLIKEINEGSKEKGVHHTIFNANGLTPGMYYYILEMNGKTSDSKKMVIMN